MGNVRSVGLTPPVAGLSKNSLGVILRKAATTIDDLTGREFNRWRCVGYVGKTISGHEWLFRCKCGKERVRVANHIVAGNSTSCGCRHREKLAARNRTHGKSNTPEHVIWKGMISRCENPKHGQYADYGERGITICHRWQGKNGFANFLSDMGPRPFSRATVERKDNAKGYSPANCKWATQKTQNRNKRNNLLITHNGKTQCLAAWAEETGIAQGCLYHRIVVAKQDAAIALTTPSGQAARRQTGRRLTHNGKTQTTTAWAKELGIRLATIYYRLRENWPIADVLAPPSQLG